MKKTKIRLIATDLDGTLLDPGKKIRPYTEEVLKKAMEEGVYVVPSTGRPIASISQNVLDLEGVRYAICSNGAAIYELPEKKRIYEKILTQEAVRAIRSLKLKETITMEAFIRGLAYTEQRYFADPRAFGATAFGEGYVKSTREPVEDWAGFLAEHETEFDGISFVSKDHAALCRLQRYLLENVSDIYAIFSLPHLLEIGHAKAGKGETLGQLLNILGIPKEEAMAFGDAENDTDMLTAVTYGIAMGNASEELKALAFEVTASNEEDGVGKAVAAALWGEE